MGITLLTPASSEYLKDFPARNTVNMDTIDDYAGPCLTSDPLQTFVPVVTATGSNPTFGTSPVFRGFYYEIFDEIDFWGEFRFGTGAPTAGSGTYIMSLPFNAKTVVGVSTILGGAPLVGHGMIWDDSSAAGRFPLTVHLRTANTVSFGYRMGSGLGVREVNSAGPISWAPSDGITFSAKFQRQP